jgi:hypothetical protein
LEACATVCVEVEKVEAVDIESSVLSISIVVPKAVLNGIAVIFTRGTPPAVSRGLLTFIVAALCVDKVAVLVASSLETIGGRVDSFIVLILLDDDGDEKLPSNDLLESANSINLTIK